MKLNTSKEKYELLEFNYHIDNSYETPINILELLVKTNEIDHIKEELSNSFIVDAEKYSYVFSEFQIHECYLVGDNLLQIVCIK